MGGGNKRENRAGWDAGKESGSGERDNNIGGEMDRRFVSDTEF